MFEAENSQYFLLDQFLLLEGSKLLRCSIKKVFHGALMGSSPLIINLARRAANILIGSRILTPPRVLGKIKVCQAILALAL